MSEAVNALLAAFRNWAQDPSSQAPAAHTYAEECTNYFTPGAAPAYGTTGIMTHAELCAFSATNKNIRAAAAQCGCYTTATRRP